MKFEKFKYEVLATSIVYGVVLLVYTVAQFWTNITFENNTLDSALSLGFFSVPLLGIYWLSFINDKEVKTPLIIVYSLILVPFYLLSSLAIAFTAADVFSKNNNGYRSIYEIKIEDERSLIVYRTPDKGALGGNFIRVEVVKRLGLGLINRDFTETRIVDTYSDFGFKVIFEGKEYNVPPLSEIESKGRLQ